MKTYYVYILSNNVSTVLYIGVTNDLIRRMYEHKKGVNNGFSKQYYLTKLVYFEETDDVCIAIKREKQIKNWHREWKMNFIRIDNPEMHDLAEGWY